MEKLIIKLKMPQPDAMELHFDCSICGKSFSSAKALGGHKRAHAHKDETNNSHHNNMELRISIPKSNNNNNNVSANNQNYCPVCNQAFNSEKSLHGHMRKHPDRNWRGMKPPTDHPEDENSDFSLNGWPKTGRRSRHGKAPIKDEELALKKKKIINNAGNLVGSSSKNKNPNLGDDHCLENPNPGRENSIKGKASVSKKNYRAQKPYVCKICKRAFRSFQALGGHKSHHECKPSGQEEVACLAGGGEEGTRNKIAFRFDLNEFPPEWNDEDW